MQPTIFAVTIVAIISGIKVTATSIDCKNYAYAAICNYNSSCIYGAQLNISCHVDKEKYGCKGDSDFQVPMTCLYCWQLPEKSYKCAQNDTCKFNSRYLSLCEVNPDTYCLGRRIFPRFKQCTTLKWSGHKWSVAMALSIFFGGLGIDRFYLGHWQEGVGKLFSFGGFGVWTLIDAILISIGYLKPADSLMA